LTQQSAVGDLELRFGTVDAVRPGDLVIAKGFFSIAEDIRQYVGLRVVPTEAQHPEGCIVGPFGKGGKAKVQFASTFTGGAGTGLTLYFQSSSSAAAAGAAAGGYGGDGGGESGGGGGDETGKEGPTGPSPSDEPK
jgi:hypothetical protein